ncbi:Fe-S cluster assembly protein SufD [Chloroflexota bacterium]
MADKKRVIKRKESSAERSSGGDFKFTQAMIPEISNGNPQPAFLNEFRSRAWEAYQKKEIPKTNEEAWRRTDIRKLEAGSFNLAQTLDSTPQVPDYLLEPLAGEAHGGQITLTAGKPEVFLAPHLAEKGVIFTDFATAVVKHSNILEKILGQLVAYDEDKFTAMTAALAGTGVLLYVPKGVQVEEPLHSVLWGAGPGLAYFSHLLVWLEETSSATYVHEFASSAEDGQTMHSGIVEIHVGEAANLRFVELQSWGKHVWNFTHERARVERDGKLDWVFGAVGSHLTKNFSEIDLVGEGAEGRMSGFYFTDGDQHLDHDTQQNHKAPNTTSDLLFKGALKDKSRSVWQGMIYVAPGAQNTDGYQSNPNLVLSEDARADSIPGLEILADDVRCTHGATIGKIDPTEVFYLESRGIPIKAAEHLIVEGFFDPVMQRIPFERVRQRLQQAIVDKLK